MLVIRDVQLEAFGLDARSRFADDLAKFLMERYPRECRQAGGASQVREFVKVGMAAAEGHGFSTRRQVRLYVSLMIMLGAGFPGDIQLPWAAEGLDQASHPDPTLRVETLFQAAVAYLETIAGKRGEAMVRALLRVREFDLATVPESRGDAWAAEVSGNWERFHPEKFRRQGPAVTLDLIREGAEKAAGYGLRDRVGVFVFATLSFMLGSGYDRDPLHPWARETLEDPAIPAGTGRGERLYAAAMAHLEQSLASR